MTDFITRDSGKRQEFASGAVRDTVEGKPRYSLIPVAALRRWADLMARGANKYGERNWELGMPTSRYLDSGMRHLFAYLEGDRTEDHLAAVLFNVGAMIHFENGEWDDLNEALSTKAAEEFLGKPLGVLHFEDFLDNGPSFVDTLLDGTQLELQPADESVSMVNWDKLRQDVSAGRIDESTVNWPHDPSSQA